MSVGGIGILGRDIIGGVRSIEGCIVGHLFLWLVLTQTK